MADALETFPSTLRLQTIDVLRRARRLPVGPNRNDLRQLAMGLRWLERNGFDTANSFPAADTGTRKTNDERELP